MEEYDDNVGDKSRLFTAFGGVYIGPPVIPSKPSSSPPVSSIPASNSAPISINNHAINVFMEPVSMSNDSLERIAQVHRPFSESTNDVTVIEAEIDESNNSPPAMESIGNNYSYNIASNEETSFVSLTRNLID